MLTQINLTWQRCVSLVDKINDQLTSYRLVLYVLLALLGWSVIGSFFHQVGFSWDHILASTALILAVCWIANKILSRALNIPANKESALISGLILTLILSPATTGSDYAILAIAAAVAMASKYVLVFRRAHIFNPAAFGAFVAGTIFSDYASWWVGSKFTLPIVAIGGILILRKIKRFSLALVFSAVYVLILILQVPTGSSTDTVQHLVWLGIIYTPLLFFATIMLTEPLTSPATLNPTLIYAVAVGVVYSLNRLHISPEESLLIGNALTFLIAPNRRFQFSFIHKVKDAEGIYSYVFSAPKNFNFKAGQYMEWTLKQAKSDSRGNRRYLTISSSPTEKQVMFTVKLPSKPSAFKQQLEQLKPGDPILASYLTGSFTLPEDTTRKLAFIAGGVGITPFRSMSKYLVDQNQKRDVGLIYAVSKKEEIAFRKVFTDLEPLGLKALCTTSAITKQTIARSLPDYHERTFYISGSQAFTEFIRLHLTELGISQSRIKTDFFPGYGN
ncbi:MAG TPA: hypothetical protein VFT49_00650 [Candidatus Saccharimonadales bacterium]|nr:hypothetical protein [Candidatus Saccharimonadales bacterium]